MVCIINGITFGYGSQEGFKKVQAIYNRGNFLRFALSGGVVADLFFNNAPLSAAYSISRHDFDTFARAVDGVPDIVKNRVRLVSGDLMAHDRLHYKEKEFWMCIFHAH